MRRALAILIPTLVEVAAYLALWPVPIDPEAWEPPPAPELTGPLSPNNGLTATCRLLEGFGEGFNGALPVEHRSVRDLILALELTLASEPASHAFPL